jgi:hypothetical protein
MSQNPETLYLGFDTAKAKLDWSLIDQQGIELTYGMVPNAVGEIATALLTIAGNYPDDFIRCVVEATGVYHYALLEACRMLNVPCIVYNAILTRQQMNASVRGKKTDRSDAFLVARVGWSGSGRVHMPEVYLTTKHYARSCSKLSTLSTSFKVYHQHLSDLVADDLSHEARELLDGIQTAITNTRRQLYKEPASLVRFRIFGGFRRPSSLLPMPDSIPRSGKAALP